MKTAVIVVLVVLSIFLLVSLGVTGYLALRSNEQSKIITAGATEQASLRQDASSLRSGLATATASIQTAEARVATLENAVGTLTANGNKVSADRDDLSAQLDRAMCSYRIPESSVTNVSSNAGLIDPITNAVERNWGFNSIDTTYESLWNNSKSAVFDVMDSDHASVKVVVSWDQETSAVNGIYDVGNSCFLYSR